MTNMIAASELPGTHLTLTEPVQAGDILEIGQPSMMHYSNGEPVGMSKLIVHVVQAGPGAPCVVILGEPRPYAGMGALWRPVATGEAVVVVGNSRTEETTDADPSA